MLPTSKTEQIDAIKPLMNIGGCLDVPSGVFVKGANGEHILLGGLGPITGVTGIGNSFKTTIMRKMILTALARMYSTTGQGHYESYDTEFNLDVARQVRLSQTEEIFANRNIELERMWVITDIAKYPYGDHWFETQREYLNEKIKLGDKTHVTTPFLDRDGKLFKMMMPTFMDIDSFSLFKTEGSVTMTEENNVGSSETNTLKMKEGRAKSDLLNILPGLCGQSNNYLALTAHIGEKINMATSKFAPKPLKSLPHLKENETIKGVSGAFFYLTSNFWYTCSAGKFMHNDSKASYYPRDKEDIDMGNGIIDLNKVEIKLLRGKFGPSGTVVPLMVSQTDGFLPELTEFYNIKDTCENYGIEGNNTTYNLIAMPSVKITRPTVRQKIDSDKKFCRALNITSEIAQCHQYFYTMRKDTADFKKIYQGVIDNGYDWDFILENTRGWWAPNNDSHPLLFLSSKDIVEMAYGRYHPYWMNDDKKTVNEKYQKLREAAIQH